MKSTTFKVRLFWNSIVLIAAVLILKGCRSQQKIMDDTIHSSSLEELVTDKDGNHYPIRNFGNTVWMTENLKATSNTKGDSISFYYPNGDRFQLEDYGLLYDFETASKVCPSGWRLPTKEEWNELINVVGQNDARIFKDPQFWEKQQNSNKSEFSVRPAGYGNNGENPNLFSEAAIFWTTSKEEDHFIWTFIFESEKDAIRSASQHPEYAFSVRCVTTCQ